MRLFQNIIDNLIPNASILCTIFFLLYKYNIFFSHRKSFQLKNKNNYSYTFIITTYHFDSYIHNN